MSQTVTCTILFADLRGSTSLYESLGNAEAATVVTHSVAVVARIMEGQGGRVIKTLGDGLMAMFPHPAGAVRAAEEVHDSLDRVMGSARPSRSPVMRVQIAMAHGEVIEVAGDCFGDAVNVSARLLDHAGDNETLITSQTLAVLAKQALVHAQAGADVHVMDVGIDADPIPGLIDMKVARSSGNGHRLARLLHHVTRGGVGGMLHLAARAGAGVSAKIDAARSQVLGAGGQVVDHRAGFAAQVAHAGLGIVQGFIGNVPRALHGVLGALQHVVCQIAGVVCNFVGGGLDTHGNSPEKMGGLSQGL